MDKIVISDLLLRCIIGIYDFERKKKQDVVINMTLYTDMRKAGASDHIEDAVDYKKITKEVIAFVENSSYNLVEALSEEIARITLKDMRVKRAIIRVEKPGALRFARSVGVEIDRSRE